MSLDNSFFYNVGQTTTGTEITTTSSAKGKQDLDMNDFLMLMVEQMKNQDIGSTMDTSEYINQLSQYTMIQAVTEMAQSVSSGFSNLQEMTLSTYSMSMIGKEATVAVADANGELSTLTGTVEGVTFYNGSPMVIIEGEQYELKSVMSLSESGSSAADQIAQAAANAANAANAAAASMDSAAESMLEAVKEILANDEETDSEAAESSAAEETQQAPSTGTGTTDAEILAGESAAAQRIAEESE